MLLQLVTTYKDSDCFLIPHLWRIITRGQIEAYGGKSQGRQNKNFNVKINC